MYKNLFKKNDYLIMYNNSYDKKLIMFITYKRDDIFYHLKYNIYNFF